MSEDYGRRLAQIRDRMGLGQKDFAAKIGMPKRTLQDLEAGKSKKPHRKTREKIDAAIGAYGEGEYAGEWDQELSTFLDLLGAYLWALPALERTRFINETVNALKPNRQRNQA